MNTLIDHRNRLLQARDQGQRSTCLAFAGSASHESKHNLNEFLSPEYLYQVCLNQSGRTPGDEVGLFFEELIPTLQKMGQTTEKICPYGSDWNLARSNSSKVMYTSGVVDDLLSFDGVISALEKDHILCVGFILTKAFWMDIKHPFIIDDSSSIEVGRHAMNVVGYGKIHDKEYLLLRNSWGVEWADNGHVWISRDHYERYATRCLVLN